MPNPFDPNSYGEPSFEDLMVGTLTESAARAKMEADERAMAEQLRRQAGATLRTPGGPWTQRKNQQPDVMQREAEGGMPVYSNRDAHRIYNKMEMEGLVERGLPIQPHLLQGLTAPEAMESLGSGLAQRPVYAGGMFKPLPLPEKVGSGGQEWDPVYTPPRDPDEVRMERAHKLDDFAGSDGLPAGVFKDRSAVEAMGMLADQLRQRRYGLGDDLAWLRDGMTDI